MAPGGESGPARECVDKIVVLGLPCPFERKSLFLYLRPSCPVSVSSYMWVRRGTVGKEGLPPRQSLVPM